MRLYLQVKLIPPYAQPRWRPARHALTPPAAPLSMHLVPKHAVTSDGSGQSGWIEANLELRVETQQPAIESRSLVQPARRLFA